MRTLYCALPFLMTSLALPLSGKDAAERPLLQPSQSPLSTGLVQGSLPPLQQTHGDPASVPGSIQQHAVSIEPCSATPAGPVNADSSQSLFKRTFVHPAMNEDSSLEPSYQFSKRIVRRAEGASFSNTPVRHDDAFHTIRIIAAVLGGMGALIVVVIAVVIYKRKQESRQKVTLSQTWPDTESVQPVLSRTRPQSSSFVASTSSGKRMSRFDQFASDFCHDERHMEERSREEELNPVMQQLQLQFRLMKQQFEATPSTTSLPGPSTARTTSTQLPPPPYTP